MCASCFAFSHRQIIANGRGNNDSARHLSLLWQLADRTGGPASNGPRLRRARRTSRAQRRLVDRRIRCGKCEALSHDRQSRCIAESHCRIRPARAQGPAPYSAQRAQSFGAWRAQPAINAANFRRTGYICNVWQGEAPLHLIFGHELIAHLLQTYGYFLVFCAVALESAGVPLPGETTLISAAVYAGATHNMHIGFVILAAAGGAILGDNIGYWVGREAGAPLLAKIGPRIGLDERRQKLGDYLFREYGGMIVFFGRFVAVLRAFAALLAGVNGLAPARFFFFNAAGGLVWATVFGLGGYLAGNAFDKIAGPFGWAMLIIAAIGAAALWTYYKKHEELLLQKAESAMQAERA
ncbi:MAG: DedA family protein [Hyphomicrobiales bacterium]|nr:DedA family protein [Hyphomicrobiales bacterium]